MTDSFVFSSERSDAKIIFFSDKINRRKLTLSETSLCRSASSLFKLAELRRGQAIVDCYVPLAFDSLSLPRHVWAFDLTVLLRRRLWAWFVSSPGCDQMLISLRTNNKSTFITGS